MGEDVKSRPSPGASRHPLPMGEGQTVSVLLPSGEGGRRPDEGRVLIEILAALDMPRDGLLRWLDHNERFCMRHGGERRYGEWLELYEQCRQALEEHHAR